jgi:hypothetical protein
MDKFGTEIPKRARPAPTLLYNESLGGKPAGFAMNNGYGNGRDKALTL